MEEEKRTLGSPITFKCGVTAKNRILKAAMVESYMEGAEGGSPTEVHNTLYKRWAEGGTGIILTGAISVDRDTKAGIQDNVLDAESDKDPFKKMADMCKLNGTIAIPQIYHPGRQAGFTRGEVSLSCSDVQLTGPMAAYCKPCRAMTEDEILDMIAKHVKTAELAKEVGFHGVQIHCAHGYLLSSFNSPLVNTRQDKWGGSTENRTRALMEILTQVRAKVGPDFILALKINSADFQQGGLTEEECTEILKKIEECKLLDFVELSGGSYESPMMMANAVPMKESTKAREGFFIEFAAKLTKVLPSTSLPICITGGLRSEEGMNKALSEGISIIGVGRPFCLDPSWPDKMLKGEMNMAPNKQVGPGENIPFHVANMHLIGKGLEPNIDLDLSPPKA